MKRLILLLLLATSTLFASAQFGVKAGLNLSNVGGDDAEDNKMLLGFYLGVYYNAMISGNISIQPELVYSMEGAKYDDGSDEFKLLLNYMKLTALLRYNMASGFFFGTGPQLGFLMSANVKADGEKVDVKDQFKGTNFAWAFALGYMSASGIGFYARYDLGLANIVDDDEADLKTRNISIGLRYNFGHAGGEARKK